MRRGASRPCTTPPSSRCWPPSHWATARCGSPSTTSTTTASARPHPPSPPLFIAANSEDSVRSAARLGLPTLSSFFVPVDELQRRHRLYRDTARAAGRSEAEIDEIESRCGGMRVVHVAPTREEALRATEPPFMSYQRKMAVLRSNATGGTVPDSFDRSLLRLRAFDEYLADGWALIGTAA